MKMPATISTQADAASIKIIFMMPSFDMLFYRYIPGLLYYLLS